MPVRLIGEDGHVRAVELERTCEEGGRLAGTGERFRVPADQVFKAIGQRLVPGELDGAAELLEVAGGKVAVDAERRTSLKGVWAGGDAVASGPDLTVAAVEDGKIAARSIHQHITG
jgi:glutamate synthase (NADPH/NADH) small chain